MKDYWDGHGEEVGWKEAESRSTIKEGQDELAEVNWVPPKHRGDVTFEQVPHEGEVFLANL